MEKTESLDLSQRIARLEGALGWWAGDGKLDPVTFGFSALLTIAAGYCAYRGLGQPNHYYQFVLGALFVAVAYQRKNLLWPSKPVQWVIAPLNAAALAACLKLILGGGERFPFFWAKYPLIRAARPEGKFSVLPEWNLAWEATPLALWSIDLTVVQLFLLVLLIFATAFEFQIFFSLIAFVLVIVSLPALIGYDWTWVFPALICIGASFYIQSARSRIVWRGRPVLES